jgi:hypothetical protein
MTRYRAQTYGGEERPEREPGGPADAAAVLGAVREDIRETLRTGWIDPAFEAAAAFPVFFTAAWSAIRPNVGKSFLVLAQGLRAQAVRSVRAAKDPPDLRKRFEEELGDGELREVEECVRAAHLTSAKVQIVVHALHRAVRGDRIPGTGKEEPPIRRGIPEWQRWMSSLLRQDPADPTGEESPLRLIGPPSPGGPPEALSGATIPFRLLGRWPKVLASVRGELEHVWDSDALRGGAIRLRRQVLAGLSSLPHPVELQWTALKARGLSDDDRTRLSGILSGHDVRMATQTLAAAFAWAAFGAPEIGAEG